MLITVWILLENGLALSGCFAATSPKGRGFRLWAGYFLTTRFRYTAKAMTADSTSVTQKACQTPVGPS